MDKYERITELARRRGFFWPSTEIYGGVSGFIDLGPLGVLLKRNIENKWRKFFIYDYQEFMVEIETPIVMPEKVFEASGHLEHFTDLIVECRQCHRKFRADHLVEEEAGIEGLEGLTPKELNEIIKEHNVRCPECQGQLGEVKTFNLLFKTNIGPYVGNVGYARPEAAQGMFTAFKRVYEVTRRRLPLGIAQVGKVLRNEISPRQGPIRLREFTIMELELFFDPKDPRCPVLEDVADEVVRVLTAESRLKKSNKPEEFEIRELIKKGIVLTEWQAFYMGLGQKFVRSLGVPDEKQMFIEKLPEERAHYAVQTHDQVVLLERWGWVEVAGYSYRTDYDLSRHMEYSGEDLRVFQEYEKPIIVKKKRVKPKMRVIGPRFKERAGEVVKLLRERLATNEKLLHELERKGSVRIEGYEITKDMIEVVEEEVKESGVRFIPHVAEPSFGAERLVYASLEYALTEKSGRTILRLPPDIAPVKVAVFPLILEDRIVSKALEIYRKLKRMGLTVIYDWSGSIGRRYARADEIGVPLAITVDGKTLDDDTVTIRDRDSWEQVRVPLHAIPEVVHKFVNLEVTFKELKEIYQLR